MIQAASTHPVSLLAAHARLGVYGGLKAFVLVPGAAETDFWERGGVHVYYLPKEIAMKAGNRRRLSPRTPPAALATQLAVRNVSPSTLHLRSGLVQPPPRPLTS
jgi:hypothetical protein